MILISQSEEFAMEITINKPRDQEATAVSIELTRLKTEFGHDFISFRQMIKN